MQRVIPKAVKQLALVLLLVVPIAVQAQFTFTTNGDNTITITRYTGPDGDVVVPDTIEGLAVTSIADQAFAYVNLTNVTIGNNVISIGNSAFFHCDNLTVITVDTN